MTPFEDLSPAEFRAKMSADSNAVLLDVRTPEEVAEARIPNSANIDFRSPDFMTEADELDKSKNYFVYCRSGARSAQACMQMRSLGFEGTLTNLKGGILGWDGDKE